jgi:para-aminobenzoate synthetase component 1
VSLLVEPVAYHRDSAERFVGLVGRAWPAFLDSGYPRSRAGRYDILAADPIATVVTWGGVTRVTTPAGIRSSVEDPFAILESLLGPPRARTADLPFVGGAIGYFGYDLARRLLPLAGSALRDSTLPDMAIGIYDTALLVDHQDCQAWVVGHDPQHVARWRQRIRVEPAVSRVSLPSFQVQSVVQPDIDRPRYARAFARIQQYLRDGDCYQVNFAQRFSARVRGDPWDGYRWLRQLNPAPYCAYLGFPFGAVLSSSPERFVRVRDGRVETKPIKGTRPRGASAAQDAALAAELLASAKDRAENVMIVDLLRNDLGKNCTIGSVRVPALCALESYATVHHLVSTVHGIVAPDRSAVRVLRDAFPGGSITGAPKRRAMEIIDELESHRRSVYCGAIGYIGYDGSMDTSIAIRTLAVDGGWLRLWAGGGIVYDSDLDGEYQECLDKARALLALFDRTRACDVDRQAGR